MTCDWCGSDLVQYIKCKLWCRVCKRISLSCADV